MQNIFKSSQADLLALYHYPSPAQFQGPTRPKSGQAKPMSTSIHETKPTQYTKMDPTLWQSKGENTTQTHKHTHT